MNKPHMETYGTAPDGTKLQQMVYTPTGLVQWPACILIHGGGFHSGGPASCRQAGLDLAAAGFLGLAITYRMDQQKLPGQTSSGQWPQQTDDVKMAVKAARNDPRCNGKVFAIGGSAGGTHACSVATEIDGGNWSAADRVDGAICISGAYAFADRTPDPNLNNFVRDIGLYCGTSMVEQLAKSPINRMDATAKPLFLRSSVNDPMPNGQWLAVIKKCSDLGLTIDSKLVPGSAHSFDNWPAIKAEAVTWLKSNP